MKKALIVGVFQFPDRNAAGIRVLGIGDILSQIGYDVYYAQTSNPDSSHFSNNRYICYKRENKSNFEYFFSISYIKKVINEIKLMPDDLIIAYHLPAIASIKLNLFCKKNNLLLIADVTERYSIKRQIGWNRPHFVFDYLLRFFFVNPWIKNIIVISSALENYYQRKHCNVIRIPQIAQQLIEPKQQIGDVIVCYCGSPTKKDVLLPLVKSVSEKRYNRIKVVVVGVSEEQFVGQTGFSKLSNTCFYGRVEHDKAIETVHNASFSIIIRPNEKYATYGFPTKLVEALSLGVPVIVSENGEIGEYIQNGVNGYLIDSINIDRSILSILDTIDKLSDQDINLMKLKALNTAKEKFVSSKYKEKMEMFINMITNKRDLN